MDDRHGIEAEMQCNKCPSRLFSVYVNTVTKTVSWVCFNCRSVYNQTNIERGQLRGTDPGSGQSAN
jgi:transposase-like protein